MIAISMTPFSHHQNIAIGDRLQHQAPEPGQDEHILDDDRARDQIGELQAHDGQDRHERVGQGVTPERRAPRNAFGARRAHEILVERLEKRRSGDARKDRRLHHAERDRRRMSAPNARIRLLPARKAAGGREPQVTAKTMTSRIASQKFGTASPIWLAPMTIASPVRPRRSAA